MSCTPPVSTTSPAYITTTSSQSSAIRPRLCETTMIVAWSSRWSSRIRWMICASMVTSSAVVGSSATRSIGSISSAMAMLARWRMPPLN